MDHRCFGKSKKNMRNEYMVQWEGILSKEASWEKALSLWQFENEVRRYWEKTTPLTRTLNSSGGGGLLRP